MQIWTMFQRCSRQAEQGAVSQSTASWNCSLHGNC